MKRTFAFMAVCASFLVNEVGAASHGSRPGFGSPGPAAGRFVTPGKQPTGAEFGSPREGDKKNYQAHIDELISKRRFGEAARVIATGEGVGGIRRYPPITDEEKEFILTKILQVVFGMKKDSDRNSEDLGQRALGDFLHPFMFSKGISDHNWARAFVCAAIASAAAHQFVTRETGKNNDHLYERFIRYIKGGKAGTFGGRTVKPKTIIESKSGISFERSFVDFFHEKMRKSFDDFLTEFNIKGLFNSYWNMVREKRLVNFVSVGTHTLNSWGSPLGRDRVNLMAPPGGSPH